jgi:hypothetical protein
MTDMMSDRRQHDDHTFDAGAAFPALFAEVPADEAAVTEAELQLLAQVAISAAARGLGPTAAPLFDAIEVLAPHHACGSVCRALTALGQRQPEVAIAELRQRGVRARVGAREARALLMLALCLAKRKAEALSLYADLAHGPDGPAKRLAQKLYAAFLRHA